MHPPPPCLPLTCLQVRYEGGHPSLAQGSRHVRWVGLHGRVGWGWGCHKVPPFGAEAPPGSESPSNVELVMSVCLSVCPLIHPKPTAAPAAVTRSAAFHGLSHA